MIGDILRKEREKQKLSIQDIEQGTSIRAVYIEALEKGEYDKLPGEVYAKGFIKNYGNFLELNGEELVRKFIMEITPTTAEPENSQQEKNSENKIAATNISTKYQSKLEDNAEENSDYKKYLVAAVALIAILIGGLVYGLSGSDSEGVEVAQKEKVTQQENKPAAETQQVAQVAETQPAPAPQPVAPPPQPPVNDVNLQATFSGDCWTRVIVDGAMVYEGMITAGQTFDWKGAQSVNVLLGNAGAAQFVMNGQAVGAIGDYGDVVEKTFTR